MWFNRSNNSAASGRVLLCNASEHWKIDLFIRYNLKTTGVGRCTVHNFQPKMCNKEVNFMHFFKIINCSIFLKFLTNFAWPKTGMANIWKIIQIRLKNLNNYSSINLKSIKLSINFLHLFDSEWYIVGWWREWLLHMYGPE